MTRMQYRWELCKLHVVSYLKCLGILMVPVVFLSLLWRAGLIDILLKTPWWGWCAIVLFVQFSIVFGRWCELLWKRWWTKYHPELPEL